MGIENASMGGVGDSISSSGLASCSLVAATANLNRAYAGSGTLHPPISGDDSSSVTVSVDDSETVCLNVECFPLIFVVFTHVTASSPFIHTIH